VEYYSTGAMAGIISKLKLPCKMSVIIIGIPSFEEGLNKN
jgi:hypothetical protein